MRELIKKIKRHKYKNKNFLILGDGLSISNNDISWVDIVSKSLKAKSVFNYSFKDTTATSNSDTYYYNDDYFEEKFRELLTKNLNPHIIVIFLGMKDLMDGLGAFDGCTRVLDGNPKDFFDTYKMIISGAQKNFPKSEIWCIGLPRVKICDKYGPDSFLQKHIVNYNKIIEFICKVILQRKKKLKFFDLYNTDNEIELNTISDLPAESTEIIADLILKYSSGD